MINRSTLKAALDATPNCLSLKDLERLAENPSQKHPHVAECPRCQTELALLREFEANAPLPDEGAAVAWISSHLDRRLEQIKNPKTRLEEKGSSGRWSWLAALFGSGNARWLVPVAAVAILVAASAILMRSSKEPELRADLGKNPPIYRSQEVEVIAPVGELPKAPQNLQWKAFSGAEVYKVLIMEVDHVPLWSAQTKDISFTIPNATRAKMLPGKPVLWQVTALDSQGRTLAVSQLQRFSVARKPIS
jgi:hypothetical protein